MRSFSFVTITPSQLDAFCATHPQGNFQQTSRMGAVREREGIRVDYVGVEENGTLVAATQLELHKSALSTFAFVHDGPLVDFSDRELCQFFFDQIKQHAKAFGAAQLEIVPELTYRVRTSNGTSLSETDDRAGIPMAASDRVATDAVENLVSSGFVHGGFDVGYTAIPRWRYLKCLEGIATEQELLDSYAKKGKRDVKTARASHVTVRRITREELPLFHQICQISCEKQGFENRELSYFELLYDCLGTTCEFDIAFIDMPAYLAEWEEKRDKLAGDIERFEGMIRTIEEQAAAGGQFRSPKKIERQLADAREKYESSLKRIETARAAIERSGEQIPAACAAFAWHERECVYLFSGSDATYAAFCAANAIQHRMMLACVERGIDRYNFYGIDGEFDNPQGAGAGLLEFKQGFNGYVEELMGSFTLPIKPLTLKAKQLAHKLLGR